MPIPLYHVDAFALGPFSGNPAAVCLLDGPADPRWMQLFARDMNLAETAFVEPRSGSWGLRWFTPTVEVELCGHATLAASHALWESGRAQPGAIRFETASGPLTATPAGDEIELDFPSTPAEPAAAPAGLLPALGLETGEVSRARFDYLVEVPLAAVVRALRPDFRALAQVDTRGLIVTSRSDDPAYDFISRFFAPQVGIDEDPVTGSAHCALAPYWSARLGKTSLTAYQASARGGRVRVQCAGNRVKLAGQAFTIARGEVAAATA